MAWKESILLVVMTKVRFQWAEWVEYEQINAPNINIYFFLFNDEKENSDGERVWRISSSVEDKFFACLFVCLIIILLKEQGNLNKFGRWAEGNMGENLKET